MLGEADGGWIEIPWARIHARILPTQFSASASRRFVFSTLSVCMVTARVASVSLQFASADSTMSWSRIDLALARILLAASTCSGTVRDDTLMFGGCFFVEI